MCSAVYSTFSRVNVPFCGLRNSDGLAFAMTGPVVLDKKTRKLYMHVQLAGQASIQVIFHAKTQLPPPDGIMTARTTNHGNFRARIKWQE